MVDKMEHNMHNSNELAFYADLNDFKNRALILVRDYLNNQPTAFHIHINPKMSAVSIELIIKEKLENLKFT